MNTYGFNSLKRNGKATLILSFPNAPSATLIRSSAEDSVHVDLYASNAFSISLQDHLFFFLSFLLILSFSPFPLFSFIFLKDGEVEARLSLKSKHGKSSKQHYKQNTGAAISQIGSHTKFTQP